MFSKGLRDMHCSHQFNVTGDGQNALSPSTENNKTVKKQSVLPSTLQAQGLGVQRLVSSLLSLCSYWASVCFSCVKPVGVRLGLTSPFRQRCCSHGTKSSSRCWTLPGKLSVACQKPRGNTQESPAGATPPLFNNSRGSSSSWRQQLPPKPQW